MIFCFWVASTAKLQQIITHEYIMIISRSRIEDRFFTAFRNRWVGRFPICHPQFSLTKHIRVKCTLFSETTPTKNCEPFHPLPQTARRKKLINSIIINVLYRIYEILWSILSVLQKKRLIYTPQAKVLSLSHSMGIDTGENSYIIIHWWIDVFHRVVKVETIFFCFCSYAQLCEHPACERQTNFCASNLLLMQTSRFSSQCGKLCRGNQFVLLPDFVFTEWNFAYKSNQRWSSSIFDIDTEKENSITKKQRSERARVANFKTL